MTKNIFNLTIPISTLCIVDDKSCDSRHEPIERNGAWRLDTLDTSMSVTYSNTLLSVDTLDTDIGPHILQHDPIYSQ